MTGRPSRMLVPRLRPDVRRRVGSPKYHLSRRTKRRGFCWPPPENRAENVPRAECGMRYWRAERLFDEADGLRSVRRSVGDHLACAIIPETLQTYGTWRLPIARVGKL